MCEIQYQGPLIYERRAQRRRVFFREGLLLENIINPVLILPIEIDDALLIGLDVDDPIDRIDRSNRIRFNLIRAQPNCTGAPAIQQSGTSLLQRTFVRSLSRTAASGIQRASGCVCVCACQP
jgi:hypothetical protein